LAKTLLTRRVLLLIHFYILIYDRTLKADETRGGNRCYVHDFGAKWDRCDALPCFCFAVGFLLVTAFVLVTLVVVVFVVVVVVVVICTCICVFKSNMCCMASPNDIRLLGKNYLEKEELLREGRNTGFTLHVFPAY
jgi:hypothetical protein